MGAQGTPQITFAIPYYDKLYYLREAVASVLAQTRSDWLLLIVDDAGPEPADALVAELGDDRITLFRNDRNLGLAGNWNTAAAMATTPWVTLLHADDRLHPDYASEVLAAADRNPALAAIFTDTDIIDADGRPARSLPETVKRFARRPDHDHDVVGDEGLAAILANNYVMCPTLCYRTDLAVDHPFDARWRMVMDLDHTAALLLAGHTLHGIRRPLYSYRRHNLNQTTSLTASSVRFEEEIALYRELVETAQAKGWARSTKTARRRWMVRVHLLTQVGIDVLGRRFRPARSKLSLLCSDFGPTRRLDRA
ncbi:MAG: glycosyltransferase [Ilumatobacteraceae bacterium]